MPEQEHEDGLKVELRERERERNCVAGMKRIFLIGFIPQTKRVSIVDTNIFTDHYINDMSEWVDGLFTISIIHLNILYIRRVIRTNLYLFPIIE